MKPKKIVFYSPICLENWDFRTMDKTGIGGSETAHTQMVYLLSKNPKLDVVSIAPCEREELGPGNVPWIPIEKYKEILNKDEDQIWIVGRDPYFFDNKLPKNKKYYFLGQDVDYDWTEERLAKVDKYICLCQTHAKWTLSKYPSLAGKIYVSTNGIDSIRLRGKLQGTFKRIPKRVIYSSSPDRGLEFILENWFRVIERHPDAKLEVFYGFDNLLKIANTNKDQKRINLYNKIITLAAKYPESVTLNGRIPQNQLYNEMLKSSIWWYPSDWPETSCITSMEMQAMGVYPIVNIFWAVGENVLHGIKLPGIPQKDSLCKASIIKELLLFMDIEEKYPDNEASNQIRKMLSEDALDSFSWEKVAKQYEGWFNEQV